MEREFDFSRFSDEQLRNLIEAAKARLVERERQHTRECVFERIRGYYSRANTVAIYRISLDEEAQWTPRTLLAMLHKDEKTATFPAFLVRVGDILDISFGGSRTYGRPQWFVAKEDGPLEEIKHDDDEHREVIESYLAGNMTLMHLLSVLSRLDEWPF